MPKNKNLSKITSYLTADTDNGILSSNVSQTITGSLTVTGNLTAQQFIVSSSVTYLTESFASGSHKFGDSSDDIHTFTGSLVVSGSANPLRIGTNLLFVSSSGLVGINNVSPTVALDVTGAGKFSGALTGTSATFSSTITSQVNGSTFGTASATGRALIIQAGSTNQAIMFKNAANGDATLFINGTSTTVDYNFNTYSVGDALVIKNSGNVGIGTASPTSAGGAFKGIDIRGSGGGSVTLGSTSTVYSYIFGESTGLYLSAVSSVPMIFSTGGAERVTLTSAGNVGIGTSSPGQKLEVKGNILIDSRSKLGSGAIDYIYFTKDRPDASTGTYEMGAIRSYTTNGYSGGLTFLSGRHTGDGNYALVPIMTIGSTDDINATNLLIGTTTGAYKLTLNGQPGANGYTAWTNYSDRRLKENIEPLVSTNILDKINLLNPVTFNYNEISGYDKETRARRISGFIAQELQEIFPEMVGTLKLNDDEYLDTNLSNLSLYLVKAIQELSAEIEILKQQ